MRIAAVIVTYNSAEVLKDCLDSLPEAATGVELVAVVVADNASHDAGPAIAREANGLPLTVVDLGRNAGYAAGVNAGLDALDLDTLDAVYVLNPDCRLRPGSIAPLAEALRPAGRGIAVPKMVNPDGSLQPSLRRTPTLGRAVAEALLGGTVAGRLWRLGETVTDPRAYERPAPYAWATGAAMLISVPALRAVGRWDESFFLYSEETEYCLRAADLGWATWYEPRSVIEHIGGAGYTDPALAALLAVNKVKLFRRRRGRLAGTAYHVVQLLGQALRALSGRAVARSCFAALLRPGRVNVP